MKLAIAMGTAVLMVTPLASAGAADVLATAAAESATPARAAQQEAPPPASDPLPWRLIVLVAAVGVIGATVGGRRETRIRFASK